MEQPIVLCGLGRMGVRVLELLQAANLPVVVVDTRCAPDDPLLKEDAPSFTATAGSGTCSRRQASPTPAAC